ncbi:MAG: hypothetical protein IJD54_02115 [Clostridia bacterium]|nr:hypothetical protein [Clostridia bacterium]
MNHLIQPKIKGISIVNPDEVERTYLLRCVDYAVKNGFNHIQLTGPIHDGVKGNVDGMTFNKKYAEFNYEKDADYINMCMDVVNEALEISNAAGIKTFMWHHELVLPTDFGKRFPEILNENGDMEVTHPLVKDYLENKIYDFFEAYPKMDGIVLTLHETKIPLLKLKNQKLGKIERVKYVTEILFNACSKLGKEMVVRPFASLAEDQDMMLKAFAEISPKLIVMDKWTKYDWSLSLPDNDFFKNIKGNPFLVETDIFGEYFGKGRLPIMFKEHIEHKYEHCGQFPHSGFVNRIDRNYQNPFGSVNEVNLVVMHALTNDLDVEDAVNKFFTERYGKAGNAVREIMEKTEENQKKIFYMNGYYFTQGSYFPEVNHAKNHFFFEIMREDYAIASNEWFIPVGWKRKSIESILAEKEEAKVEAAELLERITALKGQMSDEEYDKILLKFKNLDYVAKIWRELAYTLYNYAKYFETKAESYETALNECLKNIDDLHAQGRKELGEAFYNYLGARGYTNSIPEFGGDFCACLRANFAAEKAATAELEKQDLVDFIVCGGAMEGHKLQKEVNFSDTLLIDGMQCRIPGNKAGAKWSTINAHGWFSYLLKVNKDKENVVTFNLGSATDKLSISLDIGGEVHTIKREPIQGRKDFSFTLTPTSDFVRIRIDRIDENTPYIFSIKIK